MVRRFHLGILWLLTIDGAQGSRGSSIPDCNFSLAWLLPGFADAKTLSLFEDMIMEARRKFPGAEQQRYFGADKTQVGHTVTYLHSVASSALLDVLWTAASSADKGAAWNVSGKLNLNLKDGQRLQVRCLECIDYISHEVDGREANIGWHSDGHTLLTMALMLSNRSDFDGGSFQIRRPLATMSRHNCSGALSVDLQGRGTAEVKDLERGDALVWRGWDEHRVTPVIQGHRRVVVVEWWTEQEAEPTMPNFRPEDTHRGFQVGHSIDPLSAALPRLQAEQFREEGNVEEAIDNYRRSLDLAPSDPLPLVNLAAVFQSQGAAEEALAGYRAAYELDRTEMAAQLGLSNAFQELGRSSEAMFYAKMALSSEPRSTAALTAAGTAHLQAGHVQEAMAELQRALRINPKEAKAHGSLAGVYKNTGRNKEALKQYRKALKIDPRDAGAHNNLANLYQSMKKMPQARSSYQNALMINPRMPQAHANLGIVVGNLGLIDEAGSNFQKAIDLGDRSATVWRNLGLVHLRQGNAKAASTNLQNALRLDPHDKQARTILSNLGTEL